MGRKIMGTGSGEAPLDPVPTNQIDGDYDLMLIYIRLL